MPQRNLIESKRHQLYTNELNRRQMSRLFVNVSSEEEGENIVK